MRKILCVAALALAMALAGGGLACRTFRDRLAALEEQAVLQHQRSICGVEDAVAEVQKDGLGMVLPRAGLNYTRSQQLILGTSTAAFALVQDGAAAYTTLPQDVAEADMLAAAADTQGMLLRGRYLLLGSELAIGTGSPAVLVTAVDAADAFTARNTLLYGWLAVQAAVTAAALAAAWHYEKLQALNDRQSRFVADLTHELKTPLTSMIGYADLLRSAPLDESRRRAAADAIYHESTRLESLSQQLLALQGLQTDGVTLGSVPVAAVFADVARSLPNAALDCNAPAGAAVWADRVLLADLLRNLVLNALHAEPKDGTVHLTCAEAGGQWRLTVRDNGCGIPAGALPHLTEPFYRVDKARARANGGSGVGLALCAEIAAAFGTKLEFESTPGEGTTVAICLQKEAADDEKTH
nr:HAMP domain-containing sensor histidine kinase [uncultured Gemmiger sp.]